MDQAGASTAEEMPDPAAPRSPGLPSKMSTAASAQDRDGLLAQAARIAALARTAAPEIERARALPEWLVDELRGSGLLRAGAPAAIGALQAPPADTLACAEEIARGDASTGWCVSIAATSSLLAAYMDPVGAAEVLADPAEVAAGVWAPRGTATPVAGGVRVSGRWPFCSGISHSNWLFAGCMLDDAPDPSKALRVVAIPAAELEVLDTWRTSGLRGTGSHDAVADRVLVPAERTFSIVGAPAVVQAPLYRFPLFGFFALSIAAAALGNARGAIDDLTRLAVAKTGLGSSRTLAERPATQAAVASSEAGLRAARALFYDAIDAAWVAAQDEKPVTTQLRLGLRLAATHAVRASADVSRAMYDLGGGAAIYDDSSLQRRFRDAHTATAHFQVNPPTWELSGRLLLGLESNTTQL